MAIKKRWAALATLCVIAVVAYIARVPLGRGQPCLALLYTSDDGPFSFVHTYDSGAVGPFRIGDTKDEAFSAFPKNQIGLTMVEMSDVETQQHYYDRITNVSPQMRRFLLPHDQWQVHITSNDCPALYTLQFEGGRLTRVKVGAWMLAGL